MYRKFPEGLMNDRVATARFWSWVDVQKPNDCWVWRAGLNGNGYGYMSVPKRYGVESRTLGETPGHRGSRRIRAHSWAWCWWNASQVPEGLILLHSCDVPACVNPAHLTPGTKSQNALDAVARGQKTGRTRWRLLTQLQVDSMRRLWDSRVSKRLTQTSLGKVYGVAASTVSNIVNRKQRPARA